MKTLFKYLLVLPICFNVLTTNAQTYLHPTTGVQNTYSGGCPISTCSGTYYDNGGAGGNYNNNINSIYQVFCPNSPNICLRMTFTAFDVQPPGVFYRDYLSVGNGPAQNSTLFTTAPADVNGYIYGTPAVPFTYTANNSSGCLTLRFTSNASTVRPGWAATISCVACGARQPDGNSGCDAPTGICGTGNFAGSSPGPGSNAADGCSGCVTGETYSNWYNFTAQTTGTLNLTIAPNVPGDDLDFALYGPGATCAALGVPIRCSYAAGTGSTGMANPAVDNSEDVSGNSWVAPLNITAGQTYMLMVNNWTAGGAGYNVSFPGSTASLDCIVTNMETTNFEGKTESNLNILSWNPESSSVVDFYSLERSIDMNHWETIATEYGNQSESFSLTYVVEDKNFTPNVTNYYRLSKTFLDQKSEIKTISLINKTEPIYVIRTINMFGQEVDSDFKGLRIIQYSNGSFEKKVGK